MCALLESILGFVRAVTRSYYRGAAGALLVYDISSRESYNAISSWLSDARTLASPNIIVILVGNKKDLDAEREVTFMEASRFAQENGQHIRIYLIVKKFYNGVSEMTFLETSALTGENVEEVFLKTARSILAKIEAGTYVYMKQCICIHDVYCCRGVGPRADGIRHSIWRQITEEACHRTSTAKTKWL